jgi:hypothetical protein
MLIFGWGRVTYKRFLLEGHTQCGVCNNTIEIILTRATTWFTLFFIPVIPYRKEYYFECPICRSAAMIPREQYDALTTSAPS